MSPTDQRIDHLLHALAAVPFPAGLEQRTSARIAQRMAELDESPLAKLRAMLQASPLGPYAIAPGALTVLAAVCLLVLAHRGTRKIAGLDQPQHLLSTATVPPLEAARVRSSGHVTTAMPLNRIESPLASPPPQQDSDAIALNETLAPSRPAPTLPLTAQEALLLRSTRRGQPIEVSELDTLRESALMNRVNEQRRAGLRETLQGLLGPLATAQALTPISTPPDDSKPHADGEPPTQ